MGTLRPSFDSAHPLLTQHLINVGSSSNSIHLPEREGMLAPKFREEQAKWDKEALEKSRQDVCKLLDDIVSSEIENRKGNQADPDILDTWKRKLLARLDDTPGNPLFNYRSREVYVKLSKCESSLSKSTLYPLISRRSEEIRPGYTVEDLIKLFRLQAPREVREWRIEEALSRTGARVEYGTSPSVFNPLSLTFTKLWIEPIMRAIIHTRTFSITNDDCWYQVLAVLGHVYTESCKFEHNSSGFCQAFPAEKVLELIGLELLRPAPVKMSNTERASNRIVKFFNPELRDRKPTASSSQSLSHATMMSRRQRGIYRIE